jgi:ABC-2 type transport system permease protein
MIARFRSVTLGVAWRSLHKFLTNPALLLPSMIFPLFFFTAFAGGLSSISKVPGFDFPTGYTAFEFVFVMLQASAFGGVFTGFGIAADFESGFGRRMLLAAPHRGGIVVGYALAALTRAAITIVIITGVALATGMQVDGGAVDLGGLLGLALLVNIGAGLFASGIALRFRSMQAGPLMQIPVFLTLFMAPVYVPLPLLSGWISAVAAINPVTALLSAGRGFISGDETDVALAFGIAVALVAGFALFAIRGMRSAEAAGG